MFERGARTCQHESKTRPWAAHVAWVALHVLVVMIPLGACGDSTSGGNDVAPGTQAALGAGPCADPTGRSVCPDGRICGSLFVNGNAIPACLATCGDGEPCPTGEVCYPLVGSPGHGQCRPPCTSDGDCRKGLACAGGTCRCGSDEACRSAFGGEATTPSPFRCGANGFCRVACEKSSDCACDATCKEGLCADGCTSDDDCCGSGKCEGGHCVREGLGGERKPCLSSDDCAVGTICNMSFNRSRCMPKAKDVCSSASACPAGYSCIGYQSGAAVGASCQPSCELGDPNGACLDGMACRPLPTRPTAGVCTSACDAAQPCVAGARCDDATHACLCDADAACSAFGPNATCKAGVCSCTPSCDGRACGPDGCGGSCGTCDDTHTCAGGRCVGSCGTSRPYVSCGDGTACPPNSTCTGGACSCAAGTYATTCNGQPCPGGRCTWEFRCTACPCPAGQSCDGQGGCITGDTGSPAPGGGQPGGNGAGNDGGGGASCPNGYPVNCGTFCCPQNTICCANRMCGQNGQCPSTGSSSSSSSSSSGGGAACRSATSCVSTYSATGVCNGYIGMRNDCGTYVSCHYILTTGKQGCVPLSPGTHDCAVYSPGAGGTITCEASSNVDCINAIGCSL